MLTYTYKQMKFNQPFNQPFNQKGIALPLTLILLFAMTLLGIATLRTTTLEENLSANSRLRQVAFNAAETTLRDAELHVQSLRGNERRALFFSNGGTEFVGPDDSRPNNGDTCLDGYCTPAQFNSQASTATNGLERWEDPVLNVFAADNNPPTSRPFTDFATSNLGLNGVFQEPRYIVEFLGNFGYKELNVNAASNPLVRPKFDGPFIGGCRGANTELLAPDDEWPYCASDPGVYRITVQATAGPPQRRATVTIQSILRATGS